MPERIAPLTETKIRTVKPTQKNHKNFSMAGACIFLSPPQEENSADKIIRRFELYVFPWLGARPIKSITAPELLTILRRIEAKGTLETAHRVKQN
jgi:integrase